MKMVIVITTIEYRHYPPREEPKNHHMEMHKIYWDFRIEPPF